MSQTLKFSVPRLQFLFHVPIIALSLEFVTREVEHARAIVVTQALIALTAHAYHPVHQTVFVSTVFAIVPEVIPDLLAVLLCVEAIAPIMANVSLLENVSATADSVERIVQKLFSIV